MGKLLGRFYTAPLRVNCSPRPVKDKKKKGMISQLLAEFGPFFA
jgi:hypothetical protein